MYAISLAGPWPRAYALEAGTEFLKLWRQPAFLLPTLAFPVLFYLLFGVFMKPPSASTEMSRYLLATYASFGAIGPALFGFGVGLAEERSNGLLDLKRVLPMPPYALLLAKAVMAMLFAAIIGCLLMVVAVTLGGVSVSPLQGLCLLIALMLGTLPFAAFGMTLGCLARAQGASALVQLIYLPLGFLGGLWFPIFMLPKLMQSIAMGLPSFHFGQLSLWAIGVLPGLPMRSVGLMLAYTALFAVTAAWAWRRAA